MHALTRFSLEHSKLAIAILLLITAVFASAMPRLRHAYGYTAIVGVEHPVIQTLQDMVDEFGGGIPIRIRWECGVGLPCGSVFDDASLEMAAAATTQLSSVTGIRKVYGVANAGLLVPSPGGFTVRRFVERGSPVVDAEELGRIAIEDPSWLNTLISRDLRAGTFFLVPDSSDYRSDLAISEAIDEALAEFREQGFVFHLAGGLIDGVVAGRDLSASMSRIIPFTVLLTGLVLFLLFRSWRDVAVSLACMGIALLWTYGALALLDWPLDGILEVLAPLIMVVGVCDAVHVLSRFAELGAEQGLFTPAACRARALEVAREVGAPCFVTSATTAAAFLSFTASDLASFQRFGAISAFGVMACLVLTFSLLPILTCSFQRPRTAASQTLRTQRAWSRSLNSVVSLAETRTQAVLSGAAVLVLVGGFGWYAHLRVDTNWDESLGEGNSAVQTRRFEARHHFPTNELEIEVTLPHDAPIEAPETMARIAAFEKAATALPAVVDTRSVLALVSQVNRLLHDDDPAYQRPGASIAANAEILELISFDDPDMLGVWLNLDRSRLRITTNNRDAPARSQGSLLREIRSLANDELGPEWGIRLSGNTAVDYQWTHDVQMTQMRGFPIALGLAFGVVAWFLRSPVLAIAGLIPALLPIVVTLGAMGWSGMSLDMGRAMIATVLLGIAVDDSIHILHHYQLRRVAGDDPAAAIRAAVLHVGQAIVTTSLSLSLGFLTLTASAWQSIASFGLFVSISILTALAASLVVLPALVIACAPHIGRRLRKSHAPFGGRRTQRLDAA